MDLGQEREVHISEKIWVVTEVYYPEVISTGYYLTSIAEGLADHARVSVICGQPSYAARGIKAPKHEFKSKVEVFRVSSTTLDKNVIIYRILNMVTLGISMFAKSLFSFKKGDRVLVVTAPPSLPYTTAFAALAKGANFTLLLHDCYPDILVALGKAKPRSLFVRFLNRMNRWLFKHAAQIIVVGRDMKERMLEKTAGLEIPIHFIPNWADLENIEPEPKCRNQLLEELGIKKKFVFMYAGNIGHPTDIETIVEGASRLTDNSDIHFVFVGSGAKKQWLETAVSERNIHNVTILGQKPRSEQGIFLNACDVGLVSLTAGMWGSAMPSRTYNIMAAGKPIFALTDTGSELTRVIEEDRIGWHIEPGNVDRFCETVIAIYKDRDNVADMGERARSAALLKYSLKQAVSSYRHALLP